MKELSLKEVLKEKLEKLAEIELENANCPFMFGKMGENLIAYGHI